MDTPISPSAVSAGLTSVVLGWLFSSAQGAAARKGNMRVLSYGAPWKVVSAVMLAGLLIFAEPFITAKPLPESGKSPNPLLMATIWAVLFVPAVFLFLEAFFVRISFDRQYIYTRSPWRRKRKIPWDEVIICEQKGSAKSTAYHVKTVRSGVVKIREIIDGVECFLSEYTRQSGLPAPGRYK